MEYNHDVDSVMASARPARKSPTQPVTISVLEKPIDPRYLSLQERETIRDMSSEGASLRSIAALGRSPSTTSREIGGDGSRLDR